MAPTILVEGPYRFFFYSSDGDEPRHIHVQRDNKVAKFWLEPVRLESSGGFNRSEIASIRRLVEKHLNAFKEAWNEHFDPHGS